MVAVTAPAIEQVTAAMAATTAASTTDTAAAVAAIRVTGNFRGPFLSTCQHLLQQQPRTATAATRISTQLELQQKLQQQQQPGIDAFTLDLSAAATATRAATITRAAAKGTTTKNNS